jgi:hypothetical protein
LQIGRVREFVQDGYSTAAGSHILRQER